MPKFKNLTLNSTERNTTNIWAYYTYIRVYPCTEQYQDGVDNDGNPVIKERPGIDNRIFESTSSFPAVVQVAPDDPDNLDTRPVTDEEIIQAIKDKLNAEITV